MTFDLRPAALALALFFSPAAVAEDPASSAEAAKAALLGLAGNWSGALTYSDYETGARTELRMTASLSVAEDGATLLRTSRFDEGGGRTIAFFSASIVNLEAGAVETASFSSGRSLSADAWTIVGFDQTAPDAWSLVLERDGLDDNRPARLRETLARDGDALVSQETYDLLNDGDATSVWRNGYRLMRDAPPAEAEPAR